MSTSPGARLVAFHHRNGIKPPSPPSPPPLPPSPLVRASAPEARAQSDDQHDAGMAAITALLLINLLGIGLLGWWMLSLERQLAELRSAVATEVRP